MQSTLPMVALVVVVEAVEVLLVKPVALETLVVMPVVTVLEPHNTQVEVEVVPNTLELLETQPLGWVTVETAEHRPSQGHQ